MTICAVEMKCVFGMVDQEQVRLSKLGSLVRECWSAIPEHFVFVTLHEFVVMPNHLHGLIQIGKIAGVQATPEIQGHGVKPRSLSAIVRSFKSAVTLRAKKELAWQGDVWQRNYFERVIRDGEEFADKARYIVENPVRWELKSKKKEKAD